MKIVICDDLEQEAQVTVQYLQAYYEQHNLPVPEIIMVCNGAELQEEKNIDLLFLDIELKEESGIALAAEINQNSPNTLIVFVSNYPYYVTDAYHVEAAQFLVKPLNFTVFQREFAHILARYEAKKANFTRKYNGEVFLFQKDQVVYIESRKRVLFVLLANGKQQKYYGKIGEEAQLFAGSGIVRCHKSFLVNLAYIRKVNRDGIIVQLPNQKEVIVPVGECFYDMVCNAFLEYLCE